MVDWVRMAQSTVVTSSLDLLSNTVTNKIWFSLFNWTHGLTIITLHSQTTLPFVKPTGRVRNIWCAALCCVTVGQEACSSDAAARCSLPNNLHLESSRRFTSEFRTVSVKSLKVPHNNGTKETHWNHHVKATIVPVCKLERVELKSKSACLNKSTHSSVRTHLWWWENWGRRR